MSWRDKAIPVEQVPTTSSWRSKAIPVEAAPAEVAPVETMAQPSVPEEDSLSPFTRGAIQGATFDFGDELIAGAKAIGQDVMSFINPPTQPQVEIPRDEFGRVTPEGLETIEANTPYTSLVAEERAKMQQASDESPISFYGGSLLGSLAVPVPGMSALAATKGLGVASRLGRTALAGGAGGAIAGAGSAESLSDIPESAATGALTGAIAAPVLGTAINAAARGVGKVLDVSATMRGTKRAFNISKETVEEYNKKIKDVYKNAEQKGLKPEEIAAEIEKIPTPFGTAKRLDLDLENLTKKVDDIVEDMTSPTGIGPRGVVNRQYDAAKVIADAENFNLSIDDTIAAVNQITDDPTVKKTILNSIRESVGMKESTEPLEVAVAELKKKMAESFRSAVKSQENSLRKKSLTEAQKILVNSKKEADAVYQAKLQSKYEVDKRKFLSSEANKLRASNASGETNVDVAEEIAKLEQQLDSSFRINKVQDQATGQAVFTYESFLGDPSTGFALTGTVPTKTKFDKFGTLSPKEQTKAVQELASDLFKNKKEALDEIANSMEYKVSVEGPTISLETQLPKSADILLPEKIISKEIQPTVELSKNYLDFSNIQRVIENINDAIRVADKAGNKNLADELKFAKQAIKKSQFKKLPEEAKEALREADKLRAQIEQKDSRLLLNEPLNPLEGATTPGERTLVKDTLRRRLESDLEATSGPYFSGRKLELERAKKSLGELDETGALVPKIEEASDIAERTKLGKALFNTEGTSVAAKGGYSSKSLAIGSGVVAGRVASTPFGKALGVANFSPTMLRAKAEQAQSPTLKRYLNAMADAEGPKRKALMYVILQNSSLKEELDSLLSDEKGK